MTDKEEMVNAKIIWTVPIKIVKQEVHVATNCPQLALDSGIMYIPDKKK
jgi:hypothetical protein